MPEVLFVTMICWFQYTKKIQSLFSKEKASIHYISMCDTQNNVVYTSLFLETIYCLFLCILKPTINGYRQNIPGDKSCHFIIVNKLCLYSELY